MPPLPVNGISEPISLYIHIPFCETKCPYCDFNTYAKIETLIPSYVTALNREIELWGETLGSPAVRTVFFGGGTPSYIPSESIASILDATASSFHLEKDAEITMEANPGDFTASKLAQHLECGVNRLSIGFQSLDDRLLGILGRRHTSAQAIEAYRMAQDAGFDNISIDLMFGLPYQSIDDWKRTLDDSVELEPKHVSMYCLTLEGGTPMERWVETGRMPDPDPDLAADMFLMAQESMGSLGYRHYEISNWAKQGFESRHNLTYWRNQGYLGVGPGAHSYLWNHRFYNLKSPREYIRSLRDYEPGANEFKTVEDAIKRFPVVESVELIDRRLEISETLMMGLRLDDGISIESFNKRFDATPLQVYPKVIEELQSIGLLEAVNGSLRLTHRGRMLGNEVFSRFFE
jgi:oxygen-independent coproporphyrinogen-3 oxidase